MAQVAKLPRDSTESARDAQDPKPNQNTRIVRSLARMASIVERVVLDVEEIREDQRVQFKRLAQLQAELDAIKKAWERMTIAIT
jgi:hypothetical protein